MLLASGLTMSTLQPILMTGGSRIYMRKSVKQAFIDADTAMKRFFKKLSGFPHWRSFKRGQGSYYFVTKNGKTQIIPCQRHRIKLPKLGWVRLKELGYIPTDSEHFIH